ncbi:MAG TPA: AsmA family protein [Sulfuriferula sp.]|nr:AsmA family protein [Sulfuriferula sp.]
MATVILVAFFDWNWLRHPIERAVTEKTGRALVINGNFNVKLGWPLTRIQAADVTFANPAWAKQPLMFTVKRMDGDISLPQLFKRHFRVPTVRLEQPQVFLEQSLDGRKNWLLDRNQQDKNAKVKIDRIVLDNGRVSYTDPVRNTHIQAALSTRQTTSHGAASADIVFTAQGNFKGLPLTASGSGGTVLALNDETTPYPLNVNISLGHTRLHAVGTVTSLAKFRAVDLNMTLSGASLDQLYPLIGIALPRTSTYSTQGHLLHNAQRWRYEKFTGRVGKSDVAGNMQIDGGGKRPFLQGNLTFQMLDLNDLGSPIGMSNQNKGKAPAPNPVNPARRTAPAPSVAASNKRDVLPELPFRTERWNSVDADVKIKAKRIQRARALPIENLVARVRMNNSVLTLDPLDFGVAGGTLAGVITLDGQHNPIQAKLNIHARKILLNQLFPTIKLSKTSIGQINGDFDLRGTGSAVSQMLASADGKVVLLIDSGEISKLMMETIGLHLWEILQLKITGDKVIKLNCAVADFDVQKGVMRTRTMLLDTQITTITGSGDINMAQETLNLDLTPHTKVISPLALRSPIYIRGKFAKPEVSVDKTKLALRSAGALALGAINPFLAIIPLVDTGPGKNSECGRLIRGAQH